MEPFFITLAPRADMGTGQVVHTGHELPAVWRAACVTKIDGTAYILEPGDFLLFEVNLPHRWQPGG